MEIDLPTSPCMIPRDKVVPVFVGNQSFPSNNQYVQSRTPDVLQASDGKKWHADVAEWDQSD